MLGETRPELHESMKASAQLKQKAISASVSKFTTKAELYWVRQRFTHQCKCVWIANIVALKATQGVSALRQEKVEIVRLTLHL